MSLRINLNAAAMNAHRQMQATDKALGTSIERLSSGYRINRAADDPAGLAISENLRAQVSGLGQAVSNSSDAVNLIRTAEGALSEVHSLLRTMRNLALHAANTGANDHDSHRRRPGADRPPPCAALDRIATNTQFGTVVVLNGDGAGGDLSLDFQIGANSGQTTTVTIQGVASTALGINAIDVSSRRSRCDHPAGHRDQRCLDDESRTGCDPDGPRVEHQFTERRSGEHRGVGEFDPRLRHGGRDGAVHSQPDPAAGRYRNADPGQRCASGATETAAVEPGSTSVTDEWPDLSGKATRHFSGHGRIVCREHRPSAA